MAERFTATDLSRDYNPSLLKQVFQRIQRALAQVHRGPAIDRPRTNAFTTRRELAGSVTLTSGAATDLLTLTLSPTVGEDDCLTVAGRYTASTTAGATRSTKTGFFSGCFTSDNGSNFVASSVVTWGEATALDAGTATWTMAFAFSVSSNVATLQATSTPDTGASTTFAFHVETTGGVRADATVALAAGVTVGE